jgi:hypothetical protein
MRQKSKQRTFPVLNSLAKEIDLLENLILLFISNLGLRYERPPSNYSKILGRRANRF